MRRCLLLVAAAVAAVGCAKTTRHHVALFEPADAPAVVTPAPASATYTVQYRRAGDEGFRSLGEAKIYVPRGTSIGFERSAEAIFAVAGPVRYELDVPANATLRWRSREKRPTRFAKNMRRLGGQTADVAANAGTVLLIGGAIVAPLLDCDPGADPPRHHHDR